MIAVMNKTPDIPCLLHKTAEPARMEKEDKKLEFIGDAVIALSVRLYFVSKYPELRIKAYGEIIGDICSNTYLGKLAYELGMNPLGGIRKGYANRFEAHIAEIFHNYGFDAAKAYIWGVLEQYCKTRYNETTKKIHF